MRVATMKTSRSRRHFIAVAVGLCLIATFILWISHALQEATDNYRRQQRLYGDKWLAEQKEALRSGKQSYVYFYSTSDTDSLLAEFTGMPEVRSLTFELTDLTDAGVKSIIELPNIKKLTLYGGKPSSWR